MRLSPLFLFFILIPFAYAHAAPVLYAPTAGAILNITPEEISIRFSERIEERASSIQIIAPDGSRVREQAKVDPSDAYHFHGVIPNAGNGSYTVIWQVVSADDGHFTQGGYYFSVGKATRTSAVEISYSSTIWEAAIIWLELLGFALLCAIFAIQFFSPSQHKQQKKFFSIAAALIISGAIAYVLFKSSLLQIAQGISLIDAITLFISTSAGIAAIARVVLGAVLLIGVWKFANKTVLLGTIAILLLNARTASSHAVAATFIPPLTFIIHLLHLAAKSLWIGLLIAIPFFFVDLQNVVKQKLSRVMFLSLATATVTGLYIIWLDLKTPDNLLSTDWGKTALVILLVGTILLGIRAYHLLAHTNRLLPLEITLGIVLLFVTAVVMITTPPLAQHSFTVSIESQGLYIELSEHPYDDNVLIIKTTKGGTLVNTGIPIVTATNERRNIQNVVIETGTLAKGVYDLDKASIAVPGIWKLYVVVPQKESYDATVSFNLPSPIPERKLPGEKFTLFFIVFGMILAIGFAILYALTKQRMVVDGTFGLTTWVVLILLGIAIFVSAWFVINNHESEFEKLCIGRGDVWETAMPSRLGTPTSTQLVSGCTADGVRHFAVQGEYEYFLTGRRRH